MAKGSGNYGNLPPSMGGSKVKPSNPIGPGAPKNKSAPDGTMAKVSSPTGPGAPKNKSAPKVPDIGTRPARATGVPNPLLKAVVAKSQPKLKGLPGREGGVRPGKSNAAKRGGKNGKITLNPNLSGNAAGVPPAYGP